MCENLQSSEAIAGHTFNVHGPAGSVHVEALLTSTDQVARDLRQSSPFVGVLTEAEPREILKELLR